MRGGCEGPVRCRQYLRLGMLSGPKMEIFRKSEMDRRIWFLAPFSATIQDAAFYVQSQGSKSFKSNPTLRILFPKAKKKVEKVGSKVRFDLELIFLLFESFFGIGSLR